jgi:NADH-quinone oxidoreductase subunit G
MIGRFNEVLAKEGLADKVELKGSFCMEHCGEGINWKINDEIVSSASVEQGTETFREKVLAAVKTGPGQGK